MWLYFKDLISFLFVCVFLYIVGIILWAQIPYSYLGANFLYRQGSYGHLNTRVKEIPNYGEVDILFVGSSRVYRGFDPRIFEKHGLKVFVLGSSSQTPLQSYVLLERYMDKLKPKTVVYDLLPSTFAITGVEPTLDLLANDQIDKYSFQMALEQNDLMVWNTLLYALAADLVGVHDKLKERQYKPEEGDTYISGGYVHKNLSFNSTANCEEDSLKWKEPLQLQTEYFIKSMNFCAKRSIRFIAINMPIANYECYSNNNILRDLVKDSLNYIDFNKEFILSDSLDYYDNYHLNNAGLKKIDSFFIQNLQNL